jgi:hypothetical protein
MVLRSVLVLVTGYPCGGSRRSARTVAAAQVGTITLYTTTSRYLLLAHLLLVVVGEDF